MKIASFLPSATEILFAIGAGAEVCAVTFECDFPADARNLPQVVFSHLTTGLTPAEIDAIVSAEGAKGRSLYFVDLPALESVAPDLIVLQDLCRVCAIDSPTLARDMSLLPNSPKIISLSARTLSGVLGEILLLGDATGYLNGGRRLVGHLEARIEAVSNASKDDRSVKPRVLCLEWLDPLFQGGHWIPEMVSLAGGNPVLATAGEKSVRITWGQIVAADPEVIVVMPCGYHLAETIEQFQSIKLPPEWHSLTAVKRREVYAVDGTAYFSRPGPRLIDGLEILRAIMSRTGFEALPPDSVTRLP